MTDENRYTPAEPAQTARDDKIPNNQMSAASVPAGDKRAAGNTRGGTTVQGAIVRAEQPGRQKTTMFDAGQSPGPQPPRRS